MSKVLVVDDAASMRQMVGFTLQSAGHEVVDACDGEDGLEKAKNGSFDLVITDINMPKMDGFQLVKALRALPAYQFSPILILTTESDGDKKAEGKAAGATGWLVKPFDPDQLVATIKKVLG